VRLGRGGDRRGGADARGDVGFSTGLGRVGEVGEGKVADRAIVGFFEMWSMLCNGGVGMRKGTSTLDLLELGPLSSQGIMGIIHSAVSVYFPPSSPHPVPQPPH
jgi:hypothetical protein